MSQFSGWRKASYSSNGTNCVEVAYAPTRVGIRDSKDQTGPVLSFSTADWSKFLTLVR